MLEYLATMETADDRTRFESLYLAYRGLMYHVAYHILKNPQDAEDAVHQSFVKLAEHMATIPDGPCPRTRNLVVTVAERKELPSSGRTASSSLPPAPSGDGAG